MGRIQKKNYIKKDLNDSDNRDGVIIHLEPDILECEVKWALGSITTIKASGGDGIPAELFQILNLDSVLKSRVIISLQTGVLETTLESSLDGKEFKRVNPKGNQP